MSFTTKTNQPIQVLVTSEARESFAYENGVKLDKPQQDTKGKTLYKYTVAHAGSKDEITLIVADSTLKWGALVSLASATVTVSPRDNYGLRIKFEDVEIKQN